MALNSLTKHDRGDLCHISVSNILFSQCGWDDDYDEAVIKKKHSLYIIILGNRSTYTYTQTHFSFL